MRRMTLLTLAGTAAAVLALGPAPAIAQGFPGGGGGGMGGMGGRRGGGMGGRGGMRHQASEDEMRSRYADMASLKPLLKNISLTDTEKDTLNKIERAYRPQLGDYGVAMYNLMQPGETPDRDSVASLRAGVHKLRDQEFADARAMLTSDQQKQFDDNVTKLQADEAKHEDEMRARMSGTGP
ncbi:MAG TPA: hypothetical protein VIC55_02610 [Gemmatimonadaceae bacterium]